MVDTKYRIVMDSGCDISPRLKEELGINIVPLTIRLKDKVFVDNDELDLKSFIKEMAECETSPKTSCPSPDDYLDMYEGDEDVLFVITLSDKLSGSFNSARLAKDLYIEKNSNKRIQIFNSKSASIGGLNIALKIVDLMKELNSLEEVKEQVDAYIEEMQTVFVLENVEHLAKNGRLKSAIVRIMNIMNLKLILKATPEGEIGLVNKVRGSKKAFKRYIDVIGELSENQESKRISISHANCPAKGEFLVKELEKRYNFKEVNLIEMGGLCTTYADDGGIVVAF